MDSHMEQHQQPLGSLCAELTAQAGSPAGMLADNIPLKWPARERGCQAAQHTSEMFVCRD